MFSGVSQLRRIEAAPGAGDPYRSSLLLHNVGSPWSKIPQISARSGWCISVSRPQKEIKKEGKGGDDNFWVKTEKGSQGKRVLGALQEPLPRCEAGSVLISQDIAHHGGLRFA